MFEVRGAGFLTAETGVQAIDLDKKNRPDLITLHVTMPERSEVRSYRDLRENETWRSIPVIMMTGVSGDFRTVISSRKQVPCPDGYQSKPVDEAELLGWCDT